MKKLLQIFVTLLPILLITYGTWLIYKPCGYIILGLIIWIDLNIKDKVVK